METKPKISVAPSNLIIILLVPSKGSRGILVSSAQARIMKFVFFFYIYIFRILFNVTKMYSGNQFESLKAVEKGKFVQVVYFFSLHVLTQSHSDWLPISS